MPNFHAIKLDNINYPAICGNYTFIREYIRENQKLVLVKYNQISFFLHVIVKNGTFLIKSDKISRPSHVKYVHEALSAFSKLAKAEIIDDSQLQSSKNRVIKKNDILKNIYDIVGLKKDKEIWIEVGFGSGKHLLYQAKKNPDILLIGIEIYKPAIEQVIKQCELNDINNIIIIDYDARILLECLQSNSVKRIFVHFPVPWIKQPHRRVFSKDFVNESLRVLGSSGRLELRTDSFEYFYDAFMICSNLSKLHMNVYKNRDLSVVSKYEARWKRMEKNIFDLEVISEYIDDNVTLPVPLIFESKIITKKFSQDMEQVLIKKDDVFFRIHAYFETNNNGGILKVSLGSHERVEQRYLLIDGSDVCYFPNSLLSTTSNKLAHSILKEWLYE